VARLFSWKRRGLQGYAHVCLAGQACRRFQLFYFLWSALTGDKLPEDFKGGNGPQDLKTTADIVKFLKDSFALGHKAAATLTTQNMLQIAEHGKSPRLYLATFVVAPRI
jgi:hypothetical protein